MNYTRNMHQTATYWAKGAPNANNEPTFAAPVQVACRWERKQELFRASDGRELVSTSVVYPATELPAEGWLFEGISAATDPRTVAGAAEIKGRQASPNLAGSLVLHKVWL